MRIGFLSEENPYHPHSFSGSLFPMLRALQRAPGTDVRVLGPHRPPGKLQRAVDRLRRRTVLVERGSADGAGWDWIVSPASSNLLVEALPHLDAPIAHVTDATPKFLEEFYGWKITTAEKEARVLEAADLIFYSSDYMAARAAEEYGPQLAAKVRVVPFGANFLKTPAAHKTKRPYPPLQLLFVGKEWVRKGGDIALDTLDALVARGLDAQLTIIGSASERAKAHPRVTLIPRLEKKRRADGERLARAYREAHFLLLPTRADCTPVVVAEANAHGTPVLISDTGGIATLMQPGRNGEMLPLSAGGDAYAKRVVALTEDRRAYDALSRSSHDHYHDRLNWDAWAREVLHHLRTAPVRAPGSAA